MHKHVDINGIKVMIKPILFFILFISNFSVAQIQPFVLDRDNSRVNIGSIGDFFYDEMGVLELSELMQANYSNQFLPMHTDFMQFGVKKGNIWVRSRFSLKEVNSIPLMIKIRAPRLQILDIYIPQVSPRPIAELGELRPIANKNNYPYALIELPTNLTPIIDVYIKMASSTPINANINILPVTDLAKDQHKEYLLSGILIGFMTLLFLSFIFIFAIYKHTMYLFYSLVLLNGIILHLVLHGYLSPLLPDIFNIQAKVYNFSVLITTVATLLFSRAFLDIKNSLPEFDLAFIILSLANGIFALIYGLQPDFLDITYLSSLIALSAFFLTIVSVVATIKKVPYANIYLTARMTLFVGYSYWTLTLHGITSNMTYFFWGLTSTILLEAFIHFVGVFIRFNPFHKTHRKTESSFYNHQIFEIINDLVDRMKRQINTINGSLSYLQDARTSEQNEPSTNIEKANRNLENLLERLENLKDWQNSREEKTSGYIYVESLIDETLNAFNELDQDQIQIVLQASGIKQDEQVNHARLLKQLLLTLLLEFKNFGNKMLTVTLTKRVNAQEGISYLDIVATPLPRHIDEESITRLNLGLGYIHALINQLNGQLLTTDNNPKNKQFHITIPARYKILDRQPETDSIQACQLFIIGNQSNTRKKLFALLQSLPINIIHVKDVTEFSKHEVQKSLQGTINLIILLEHVGYIPQLVIRQIKPLLRIEDQCLLISDNFKMPKNFAVTLGFDELIHSLELEQQFKTTVARLTEKGLRLQKARLL